MPPAVALLLALGPIAMAGSGNGNGGAARLDAATADAPSAVPAAAAPPAAGTDEVKRPALPRTPDLWQLGSTLLGVLLLGGAGVLVLRQLRAGPRPKGDALVALRQTVRLGKQALHAVEFDGRLLLLGEGDRGLQLLHDGALPEQVADEREIARRAGDTAAPPVADDDDDGAVPKNLVIPRPEPRAAQVARSPGTSGPAGAKRPPQAAAQRTLGDFRALLAKAGR